MGAGRSTYQTYVMIGTGEGDNITYSKLLDVVSIPDLGQEPETIDTTTLSDYMQTFIPGIQGNSNMTFEANYTPENFNAVKQYNDGKPHPIAVWFGATGWMDPTEKPDGHAGKFSFTGYITPQLAGGGVNEKVTMNIIVTPNSVIKFDVPEGTTSGGTTGGTTGGSEGTTP